MASGAASANQDAWKRSTNPLDHCDVVTKKTNTTDYMCKHCNHTFSGTKTRCYVHLTGDGTGVRQCSKCPAEVQRALKAAKAKDQGKGNLKRKAEEDVHEQRRSSHSEAGAGPSSGAATAGFDNTAVSIEACTASISDAAVAAGPNVVVNVQTRTRGTYRSPQAAYNVQRTTYNVQNVQRTEHPWLWSW
jgi:hypothetical protein